MTMAAVLAADSMSMTTIWYFAAGLGPGKPGAGGRPLKPRPRRSRRSRAATGRKRFVRVKIDDARTMLY